MQLTASQADTVQSAIESFMNEVREGDEFDGLKDVSVESMLRVDALLGTGYIESFRYQHQTLLPAPSSNGTGESKCR